jgi:hypothetical protein
VTKNTRDGLHDVVVPPPVIGDSLDPWSARRADSVGDQDNPLHSQLLEVLGAILLTCFAAWSSWNSHTALPLKPTTNRDETTVSPHCEAAISRPPALNDSLKQNSEEELGRVRATTALLRQHQPQFDWQWLIALSDSINQRQQAMPQYSQEYIDLAVSRRNELKTEAAELRKSLQEPASLMTSFSAAKRERLQLRQRIIEQQIFDFERIIVQHREFKGIEAR